MKASAERSAVGKQPSPTQILQSQYDILSQLSRQISDQNEILRDPMTGLDNCIIRHRVSVKIEDINMPFSAMVGLMIKIGVASIPAIIILIMIFAVLGSLAFSFLAALAAGLVS